MQPADAFHANVLTLTLEQLRRHDPKSADTFKDAIIQTFTSPEGVKCLELLDNAVLRSMPPPCADDRALRETHGQRLLVAEIRSIVRNG